MHHNPGSSIASLPSPLSLLVPLDRFPAKAVFRKLSLHHLLIMHLLPSVLDSHEMFFPSMGFLGDVLANTRLANPAMILNGLQCVSLTPLG